MARAVKQQEYEAVSPIAMPIIWLVALGGRLGGCKCIHEARRMVLEAFVKQQNGS